MGALDNLRSGMASGKSRVLMIILVAVCLFLIIYSYYKFKTHDATVGGPTSGINNQAQRIASVPGVKASSEEYIKLQEQQNIAEARQAAQSGGSAIPTLLKPAQANDSLDQIFGAKAPPKNDLDSALEQQRKLLAQSQQQQLLQQQSQAMFAQEAQAKQAQLAALAQQAKNLMAMWMPVAQNYTSGSDIAGAGEQAAGKTAALTAAQNAVNAHTPGQIYGRAGDVYFAVLQTGVNSDEPGPIMAEIVQGPLKGSKVIGAMQVGTSSVLLRFNVINIPGAQQSFGISAVAIDPDTARTAMATDVNNHYLLRYGTLFAATFMQGLADALKSNKTASFLTDQGNKVNLGNQSAFSPLEQTEIALGTTGQNLVSQINLINIPATIKVASGTSIGILLQADMVAQTPVTGTQQQTNGMASASMSGMMPTGQPMQSLQTSGLPTTGQPVGSMLPPPIRTQLAETTITSGAGNQPTTTFTSTVTR